MTQAAQPRVLSLDEICKRVDRSAEDWIAGKDVRRDELLESSIEAHGLTIAQIVTRCVTNDRRPRRAP